MYKISAASTGEQIAIVEKLTYIKKHSNGCYVLCDVNDPKEATTIQGIAYNGSPYNLFGKESMGENLTTVIISEIDGGTELEARKAENTSLSNQLTDSQLALCDVYEQAIKSDQQVTEAQLALCDVYEQLLALTSQTEGGEPT